MYYAIGPHCWGKGTTKRKAIARASENWPIIFGPLKASPDKFNVYETEDKHARVNDYGWLISKKPAILVQKSSMAKLTEKKDEPVQESRTE